MTVLVTGGAGFIGSHVVRLLTARGDEVVIVDDLVTGLRARVPNVPLIHMDLADTDAQQVLEVVMRDHRVTRVIHFAGRKQVAESVARPAWYFQQNIASLANLIMAMENARVNQLVFSSSAAVYGASEGHALAEIEPLSPINPYGESKLIGEWLISNAVRSLGLRASSLRYFNVGGAGWPELGDSAVLNLVPMVMERLNAGLAPVIFGDDYDTADGTCIRDYVHVLDLAEAHLATLDSLRLGDARHDIYNVGTGLGSSVREMITEIIAISNVNVSPTILDRRVGDPAVVVADVRKIAQAIGWSTRFNTSDIIESAWDSNRVLNLATIRPELVVPR